MSQLVGTIAQIIGPVVDVKFDGSKGELPKIYEALEATGIPPGVFFFVGGLALSLVALIGFGSVWFATLLFLVACGVGVGFFVLGARDKEADVADAIKTRESLERVLAQKEEELAVVEKQRPT